MRGLLAHLRGGLTGIPLPRARAAALLACAAAILAAGCGRNGEFPSRPLTMIVPWGAGGGTDAVARIMASRMESVLGQPVNVVNRTGGSGVVGHQSIADAAADGYTVGIITTEIAMMRHLGLTDLTGDSFTPLGLINFDATAIHVRASSPYQSLGDLLEAIRASPGRLKASGTAQGGIWHVSLYGLGTVIGALPGAGADIAAWMAYGISKRFSRTPERFGTGHLEGLAEAGAANSASLSGAWIPALVFGIPGDSITAIVIGVLYLKGMNPGPTIFIENPQNIYAVLIIFLVANVVMLPLGWVLIKLAGKVLHVPRNLLMPIILLFSVVGAFAINNSVVDVAVMLGFGVLAYVMEANGFPIAPTILGVVLGSMLEQNLVSSLIKADGRMLAFFERPIAGTLGAATIAVWTWTAISSALRARRSPP